jgi:hypothetical protein
VQQAFLSDNSLFVILKTTVQYNTDQADYNSLS